MADRGDVREIVSKAIADPATGWSLGTFGAIAEFLRDAGEEVSLADDSAAASAVTARGGIRISPVPGLRAFAYETGIGKGDRWSHAVALCLPEGDCAMNRREVLTELGPDEEALRPEDRSAILFDMGLGCLQVDACVRTADPDCIELLRSGVGRSLLDPDNPLIHGLIRLQPHRVFISRAGRIEVCQPIPAADGRSPEGPHTHILPRLLRLGRTHAATEPIPQGWVPCAHLFPPHPLKDALGRPKPFAAQEHYAFQEILDRYGDPRLVALKRRVAAAVQAGEDPSRLDVPKDRFARSSVRAGLRQMAVLGSAGRHLSSWMRRYNGAEDAERDEEGSEGGHPARS
jgi:hypothetical protein